ncbi:hypothetical protein B4168_3100 [Anoxybacillus flavithermus]|nr:hypothetical protein B4168_3100 [Anoxybacillus flavithermus]OAO86387.1 hypothetical protein GT23_2280 [Parageobacillus thermoglucosidasius]
MFFFCPVYHSYEVMGKKSGGALNRARKANVKERSRQDSTFSKRGRRRGI